MAYACTGLNGPRQRESIEPHAEVPATLICRAMDDAALMPANVGSRFIGRLPCFSARLRR